MVHESLESLFLEGSETIAGTLRVRDFPPKFSTGDALEADYFQVGLRPDSDWAAVLGLGNQIFREDNYLLIRVPGTPVDALYEARVLVSRLPHRPVDIPVAVPPDPKRAGTPHR